MPITKIFKCQIETRWYNSVNTIIKGDAHEDGIWSTIRPVPKLIMTPVKASNSNFTIYSFRTRRIYWQRTRK